MDIVEDLRTTVRSSNPDFFQKAADEIEQLRAALLIAVTQNEHDMLLTGEELRVCRRALTPNVRGEPAPAAGKE